MEGTNKIGLALNLKSAWAMGISIPWEIRVRADHVIESPGTPAGGRTFFVPGSVGPGTQGGMDRQHRERAERWSCGDAAGARASARMRRGRREAMGKLIRGVGAGAMAALLMAGPGSALDVGQKAPDFTLTAPGNKPVKLADLLGKGPVVLYTFIQAFTAA